ncbi:MAG: methyltransferase domain-containing protein, partial [Ktedonobacteraceae bacterium]|nr:methyltransferase domain-containing protein [Ktedonobacteraceae bacterium]
MDPTTTQASYDRLASAYAQQLGDELDHKPRERQLLASFAHENPGQLGDVGCGPGHITAYLHAQGNDVVGVDLSPAMIAQARQTHPTLTFRQADMRHLPFADGTLSGIVAFYSLIHI